MTALLFILAAGFLLLPKMSKAYDPPSVVINEIMYNPQSGVDADEFLELYNTTDADISLTGWCFTAGINLCFSGQTIQAHSYLLISPNSVQTMTTYGASTAATYTGKLDNGGERITLQDNNHVTINSVLYDDVSPWPTAPDGNGHSLELKDPNMDNTIASSWGADIGAPTPGAVNSITNINPPTVSNVNHPTGVAPSTSKVITAQVENAADVQLVYRINYETDQNLTMYDDGAHGDGAADDGVYGATIPGQAAGKLVRYRVEATNVSAEAKAPSNDDSIDYYGYVIQNSSLPTTVPVLQYFMSDADAAAMAVEDNFVPEINNTIPFTEYNCVVTYGDQVFDNSLIRLKGEYSSRPEWPKRPHKIDLPSGYAMDIPDVSPYPIKQFHLNSDFPQNNYIHSLAAWDVFDYAGFPDHARGKVYVNQNGSFEGAFTMIVKYDKPWRAHHLSVSGNGFSTGLMYEDYFDILTGDDPSHLLRNAAQDALDQPDSPERRQYAMDNLEIPNIINLMAVEAVIRNNDWGVNNNVISYLDTEGNGRWSAQPWDLDLSSTQEWDGTQVTNDTGYTYEIDPYETVQHQDTHMRYLFTPIWDDPVLREMYKRRIRTLTDEVLVSGQYKEWLQAEYDKAKDALDADYNKYYDYEVDQLQYVLNILSGLGVSNGPAAVATISPYLYGPDWQSYPWDDDYYTELKPLNPYDRKVALFAQADMRARNLTGKYVQDGYVLESQPAVPEVKISEIKYGTTDGLDDYVELYNPNNTPIDITGWTLNGVSLTMPGGAVLPANGYGVVVKNDPHFRQTYGGGKYVVATYQGNLDTDGETLSLVRKDASVASTVSYSAAEPWPVAATTGEHSLELLSPQADPSKAACWGPSVGMGSPYAANDVDPTWYAAHINDCIPPVSVVVRAGSTTESSATTLSATISPDTVAEVAAADSATITDVKNEPATHESAPKRATHQVSEWPLFIKVIGGISLLALAWALLGRLVWAKQS